MKRWYVFSIVGAVIALLGVFLLPWFEIEEELIRGYEIFQGQVVIVFSILTIILSFLSFFIGKERTLAKGDLILGALLIFVLIISALNIRDILGIEQKTSLIFTEGFYLTLFGGIIILLSSVLVFTSETRWTLGTKLLKIGFLWKGSLIKEKILLEPKDFNIGEDIKNDISFPAKDLPPKYPLFKVDKSGKYKIGLTRDLKGNVRIKGVSARIDDYVKKHTTDISGINFVPIQYEDWGIIDIEDFSLFFQFVTPEEKIGRKSLLAFDKNIASTTLISAIILFTLILSSIFFWKEDFDYLRKQNIKKLLKIDVQLSSEEEMLELGEENDTTGKKAEGEEGKFGDPDIDPNIESKIPKRDGKMVSKIDPKKIGLNDLLSTNKLGGKGAISTILSADSGFSNKLAVAMSGTGSELVVGHGAGGMGFKGTGPGGGGTGGYGRIHGLGKVDTGGGMGVRANLGTKGKGRIGKFNLGAGSSTGFCERSDIQRVVLQRAGAIRACYEAQLQIHQDLAGKITARWTITLEGVVEGASIVGSTLGNSSVENCVLRTIRRMRFKKPEGGICIVQWPFVFNPG